MYKHVQNHFRHGEEYSSCEHNNFFTQAQSSAQKCYTASHDCDYQFQFINFFSLSYCLMDGYWLVVVLLCLLVIMLIFRFIQSVVEEYLAPSIEYITEWLELSQALGAVTLLALANGAGDVVTAIAASGEQGGLAYIVGSIYGAGLFVCSIVVAITIYQRKKSIQLEPSLIWRDVGFYILSTIIIIIFAIIGKLNVVSAIMLLLLYIIMVIVVWLQEKHKDPLTKIHDAVDINLPTQEQLPEIFDNMNLVYFPLDKTDEEQQAFPNKWRNIMKKKSQSDEDDEEKPFAEMKLLDQFVFVVDLPFQFMRYVTLPPCDWKKYSKQQAMIFPIPGVIFIYLCFIPSLSEVDYIFLGPLIIFGGLCSLNVYLTSAQSEPPRYYILLQVFGTVGAIMWSYIVCGMLIDVLQFLGMISKLDKTYMGLTVVAVGNALPDAITTIAFAKQGYAVMGLTGAYAGQLFGLLIGFGLSLLKKTYTSGPQSFDLFDPTQLTNNFMNIFVISVSLINLLITFAYGVTNKYKYDKNLAKIIGLLYLLFVVIATTTALIKVLE